MLAFLLGIYVGGVVVTICNCVFGFKKEKQVFKMLNREVKLRGVDIGACILTVIFWPFLIAYSFFIMNSDENQYGHSLTAKGPIKGLIENDLIKKVPPTAGVNAGLVLCIKCTERYDMMLDYCPYCNFKKFGPTM
jgi:hypothetical protein